MVPEHQCPLMDRVSPCLTPSSGDLQDKCWLSIQQRKPGRGGLDHGQGTALGADHRGLNPDSDKFCAGRQLQGPQCPPLVKWEC